MSESEHDEGARHDAVDRPQRSLWAEITTSGVVHLLAARFIQVASLLVAYPFLPALSTDLFAGQACESYAVDTAPPACQDAHSAVVFASAAASLVSNCCVSLLLNPLLGAWSDVHGRKPVIMLGFAATLPPLVAYLAASLGMVPAWFPYACSALCDGVSSFSVSQAYMADVISPAHRAVAFGILTAVISAALLIGPASSQLVPNAQTALGIALAGMVLSIVWLAFLLPESQQDKSQVVQPGGPRQRTSALAALRHALRTPLFRQLAAFGALLSVCADALSDVVSQTLQLRLNFTPSDQAVYFMIYGICGIAVQAFLMRPLLANCGERGAIALGLAALSARLVLLSLPFLTKSLAFATAAVGTLAEVVFPALSALQANSTPENEQGAAQGGLYAARSLALGIAPLGWAALFRETTRRDRPVAGPSEQYVFVLAAALAAIGATCALALPTLANEDQGPVEEASPDLQPAMGDGDLREPLLAGEADAADVGIA
jgi:DHA1 family tetracycline resistance protein-like MFS transporter